MGVESYNPSADGIVAKCWECMRRNPQFNADIKRLRGESLISAEMPETYVRIGDTNPMASFVFNEVICSLAPRRSAIERKCWRRLNARLKTLCEEYVEHGLTPTPFPLGFSGLEPEDRHPISGEKFKDGFFVVAIPKRLRDSEHRKKVIAWLEERVPRPLTKGIHLRDELPSGGKLLGTAKDWELFLFFESMRALKNGRSKIDREHALHITAWRFYEKESFDHKAIATPGGKRAAREVYVRRGDRVRAHIKAIEDGISSVYPIFSAFRSDLLPPLL